MMEHSLVAFDADRVKEYVFATGRLKEIRGASALLDRLNRQVMARLVTGEAIFAGGGAGLFVVEKDAVSEIIHRVSCAYRQTTLTASLSGAAVPLPETYTGNIRDTLALARYRLRQAKNNHSQIQTPLTHPLLHFCGSCGVQPAVDYSQEDLLCHSCRIKRQENETVTRAIRDLATNPNELYSVSPLWGRLLTELQAAGYPTTGYGRPEEFETLGEMSQPGNYMALIYADGDGMGQIMEQIATLEEMGRFATAIDDAVYQSVREAITTHLVPQNGDTWPFDILLLGGDDLIMVTQAQSGLETALHIVNRFPELTKTTWGTALNLSATVVIAHVNYPIGALLKLAESSLRFAKRQAALRRRAGEQWVGGLLNFLVVSSNNHLDFGEYYRQTLCQEEGQQLIYRTQRPYTAAAMGTLLGQVRKLKRQRVPRTKLEQLRTAVFKNRRQGTVDAIMAILRLRRQQHRQAILELVGTSDSQQLNLPWIPHGDSWSTPILDISELFDFVPEEEASSEEE